MELNVKRQAAEEQGDVTDPSSPPTIDGKRIKMEAVSAVAWQDYNEVCILFLWMLVPYSYSGVWKDACKGHFLYCANLMNQPLQDVKVLERPAYADALSNEVYTTEAPEQVSKRRKREEPGLVSSAQSSCIKSKPQLCIAAMAWQHGLV